MNQPNTTQAAAEIIARQISHTDGYSRHDLVRGHHIAAALAGAGLLVDPATRTPTDEQQAVIEAAIAARQMRCIPVTHADRDLRTALFAAVDRLTATKEQT